MAVTYADKQKLLQQLSSLSNWQNTFDIDFYVDSLRKAPSKQSGNLTISATADNSRTLVTSSQTDARILITQIGDDLSITDNFGNHYAIQNSQINTSTRLETTPITAEDNLDTDKKSIFLVRNLEIHFNEDTTVTVLNRDRNSKITFPSASQESNELKNRRFVHTFSVPNSLISQWGLQKDRAISFVKLVLAHEIGLQPNLRAFSGLDEDNMNRLLNHILSTDSKAKEALAKKTMTAAQLITKKIEKDEIDSSLQKPWTDSTEFDGQFTETPSNFSISLTPDGFDVHIDLYGREDIVSCSTIFGQSVLGPTILQPINARTTPQNLQQYLEKGTDSADHRGDNWVYGAVETADSTSNLREQLLIDKFGLSSGQYTFIRFDTDYAVLALRQSALESLAERDTKKLSTTLINETVDNTPRTGMHLH